MEGERNRGERILSVVFPELHPEIVLDVLQDALSKEVGELGLDGGRYGLRCVIYDKLDSYAAWRWERRSSIHTAIVTAVLAGLDLPVTLLRGVTFVWSNDDGCPRVLLGLRKMRRS